MMGDIFRDAVEVLAWLGTPDLLELSDAELDTRAESPQVIEVPAFNLVTRAMHIKRVLGLVIKSHENGGASVDDVDSSITWDKSWGPKAHEKPDWLEDIIQDVENAHELTQLAELCQVEYWNRLWIMQEVCLGRHLLLLYGRHTMNWSSFRDFRQAILRSGIPSKLAGFPPAMNQILTSRLWRILQVIEEGMKPQMHMVYSASSTRTADWFLGTDLQSALQLSQDAFCHERRDKVFGILGLADDVDTGDIAVDYSISLFELYSNVMVFHRGRVYEERLRDGSHGVYEFQADITTSMVEFSKLLQNALFGPDFRDEAYGAMRRARINLPEPEGWGPWLENIHLLGHVVDGVAAVCHRHELLASFLRENSATRTQSSGLIDSVIRELKKTWELSKYMFDLLAPDRRPDEDVGAELGLALFSTDQHIIGIAPRGIRAGDALWKCASDDPLLVIVRPVDRMFKPVGRACLVTELGGEWKAVVPHHDVSNGSKRSEDRISLPLGIDTFQVLTCPLRHDRHRGAEAPEDHAS